VRPLVGLDKELNRNRIVNKSHAAAYAVISVRTAWLKYYYPAVFWTETLNSVINKADKIRKYLYCAQKHGMHIVPPSVNNSAIKFSYEGTNIYIGLSALRDLGKASLPVIAERQSNGKYKTFDDFVERCKPGKKVLTSLAYSGAFDEFDCTRQQIVNNTEVIADYLKALSKYDSWADFDEINKEYLSLVSLDIPHCDEYPKQEKLQYEYNYAGMYVSEHPLDEHMFAIDTLEPDYITDLIYEAIDDDNVNYRNLKKKAKVIGILKDIETKITKKGDQMVVGTIEDKTGTIKFTIFSGVLDDPAFKKELLVENGIVLMDATREVDDFGSKLTVFAINEVTSFRDNFSNVFCLTDMEHYKHLVDVARNCDPGNLVVVLRIQFRKDATATVYIDSESDNLYTNRYRTRNDARNLRVDFSGYMKLKEASKRIHVS
jgi:DNA polymerase III alpha subunit